MAAMPPHPTTRESLAAAFERHAEEEGKILAQYQALADKLGESPAKFLIRLILTEEELHHQLLSATAKWLREHTVAEERSIPSVGSPDELVRCTEQLRQHEVDTIEACRSLRAELAGTGGALLASVLDVMAMDSEKHHRLLTTVLMMIRG
jgi:hypothetical protein